MRPYQGLREPSQSPNAFRHSILVPQIGVAPTRGFRPTSTSSLRVCCSTTAGYFIGAQGETRTLTPKNPILNRTRLPVPPHGHLIWSPRPGFEPAHPKTPGLKPGASTIPPQGGTELVPLEGLAPTRPKTLVSETNAPAITPQRH